VNVDCVLLRTTVSLMFVYKAYFAAVVAVAAAVTFCAPE